MSLIDEARERTSRKGSVCSVAAIARDLGDELTNALNSELQTTAICRALRDRGYMIAPDTLGRHRAGECLCPR